MCMARDCFSLLLMLLLSFSFSLFSYLSPSTIHPFTPLPITPTRLAREKRETRKVGQPGGKAEDRMRKKENLYKRPWMRCFFLGANMQGMDDGVVIW